ncbi:ATP phosphoribosyltransferase [Pelagicoccus sp. SDUM812003]|uniref:ATP phosphoribosyltransferase n=1 Tax=Pelagicoccus sp. SDUM812003 TaxID=3041267 RepID=UPI00280C9888|nr:ATP phosphoribosyltransferase [Pelagicoccus sp. SDUM812003]MDQ8204917.1 ATP phosphoribosyltransferase [Pelagicoccus sp. SDUM812003]
MFGLPKGSLEEPTISLFAKAGWNIRKGSRSYKPSIDDSELDGRFVRSQEISRYVDHGYFDCGLCGYDWVVENGSDVVEVCDLVYSRASNRPSYWVLAVPEASPIKTVKDLQGKRIATEVVNLTRKFLADHGVEAEVEFSWGATEVKVPDMVDAIVDLTETGNSLRANKLRIVETLLKTNTKLIANRKSWENPEKRAKIETIAMMLQAALSAADKVGLKLNAPKASLAKILEVLPSLRNPTVNDLSDEGWSAVEVVLSEKEVRDVIPQLKDLGAEGIIEYPLNKIVY